MLTRFFRCELLDYYKQLKRKLLTNLRIYCAQRPFHIRYETNLHIYLRQRYIRDICLQQQL